ncbi:MAG: NIL domain-containing protein [Caldimicrobium sp.]|jgi:ferredoxin|uniref:(Fe-S)-binding protein n=1 Tax=Caldimicrobium thiodismutans TaxID=1653476 RepID=A0A2N7PJY1_9BACT|nr:MAG: (Fe-S)-binding protein [Caldimicrobium thiodismutans]
MLKKGLYLRFPPEIVEKPIVYRLVKDYNLAFNILKATITPGKEGIMILELMGDNRESLEQGLEFLKQMGVEIQPLGQQVLKNEEVCIHCGACTAVCPTGALSVDRNTFKVIFDPEKCTACGFCVSACITKAMEIHIQSEAA